MPQAIRVDCLALADPLLLTRGMFRPLPIVFNIACSEHLGIHQYDLSVVGLGLWARSPPNEELQGLFE